MRYRPTSAHCPCWRYYWLLQGRFLSYGGTFPYLDGILTPHGAYSPVTVLGGRPLLMGRALRLVLSVLGCVAGASLLARLRLPGPGRPPVSLLLVFTLIHIPLIFFGVRAFDRYLLVLFPGAIALAARGGGPLRRWQGALGLALLGPFLVASAGMTHDSLAWNAARWALGRRALAQGIHPWDIEGGFEWDGWFSPRNPTASPVPRLYQLPLTAHRFPHVRAHHALAFTVPGGTQLRGAEPYVQWLVRGRFEFVRVEYPEDPILGPPPHEPLDPEVWVPIGLTWPRPARQRGGRTVAR